MRPATSRPQTELLPAARRMLVLAGDRAAALDQAAADGFYRRALALYEADDAEQAPLLLKAGKTASMLTAAQAEQDARRAADLYLSAGDELGAAEALLDLTRFVGYRGSDAEEREHLQEAKRLIERHPPGRVAVLLLEREAGNAMMAGRAADCLASADAAMTLAEELGEGRDLYERVLQYRGVARTELGDVGGLDDIREAIERSIKAMQAVAAGIGHLNLADATWYMIGAQQSLELHKKTQAFDESRGLRGAGLWSQAESTWMLFDLARWDEILAITDDLAALEGGIGAAQIRLLGLPYRALVLERRGDPAAAAAVVEHVLPKARAAADLQLLVPSLAVAALVADARDDRDGALGFIRELVELTRGRSDRHRALFLPELARVCAARNALDLARELAKGLSIDLGRVGAARVDAAGVLAEAEGALAEALALYEQASKVWHEFGGIPQRAEVLLGQGRCRIALGYAGAEVPLAQARDLLQSMGYKPALAETEKLLAEIVGTSS